MSCAETLAELRGTATAAAAADSVTLVTASTTVKTPRNVKQLARTLVTFDILEENIAALAAGGIRVVHGTVEHVDVAQRVRPGAPAPAGRTWTC